MRERLATFLGEVFWSDLAAHAARDALIIVADDLDMLDVGVAVATDDASRVGRWIEEQRLKKPTSQDLARFRAEPEAKFESLIVQPFVLVRPLIRRPDAALN
ncbi:Hypothetical protein A7982_03047 [Minicystis rosea]|nr:Hypothetical protein A7982_03047 [Minicystis rosea]